MKNKNSIENEVLTLAHKRIDAFAAEVDSGVESWKALHGEAMACRDLDVTLQRGIALYDAFVTTYDEMWTAEIAGKIEHSDARDAAFRKLFEMWLVPCKLVETAIIEGYEDEALDAARRLVQIEKSATLLIRTQAYDLLKRHPRVGGSR